MLNLLTTSQAENCQPHEYHDITPLQLAAFYKSVGGNYDILFLDTPPNAVAYIYQSLGCLHSLQPGFRNNGFQPPSMPALKPRGFVTWQTIQLLLGPDEHVPFIQSAVRQFNLLDPETGSAYPKILPKECFPTQPDPEMVRWYEDVSEKLKQENEEDISSPSDASRTQTKQQERDGPIIESVDTSADERTEAAKYFSNPMYRNQIERPSAVRRPSRTSPRQPAEFVTNCGRGVVSGIRHMWNPHLELPSREDRRRSWHGVSGGEYYGDDVGGPGVVATARRPPTRGQARDRVRSTSRGSLSSTASSDGRKPRTIRVTSNDARRVSRQREDEYYKESQPTSPRIRAVPRVALSRVASRSARHGQAASPLYNADRRSSHDSPRSPEDYFPKYPREEDFYYRRHGSANQGRALPQSSPRSPPDPFESVRSTDFSPSTGASFAAHVAHLQSSTSSLNGSGISEDREDHLLGGRDRSDRTLGERSAFDARTSGISRPSRESGEGTPLRHETSARSARRDKDQGLDMDHQRHNRRSHSIEGRYSRERRDRDRNRGHEEESDRGIHRQRNLERESRDIRGSKGDREARQRRTRFAAVGVSNTNGVDGRRYPDWD